MTNSMVLENYSGKNLPPQKNSWLILSIASAISFGLYSFFQYIILKKDPKLSTISLAIFIALVEAIIGIIWYGLFKLKQLRHFEPSLLGGIFKNYTKDFKELLTSIKKLPFSVGGAAFNLIGLVGLLIGYIGSPNPGFSDAISDAYLIPQAILAYFLFKTKMNSLQMLGAGGAIFGIYLLST